MPERHQHHGQDRDFSAELVRILPHLRAFARGLCGSADLADDLVQEAASKAWAARNRFEPGTSLKAWTFTILRNHFLNEIRKYRREINLGDDTTHLNLAERPKQEDQLHLNDLELALQKLPDDRREALLLVGASGFSYEEAAEVCGVALGTMKSRVSRARVALADIMRTSQQ